MIGYEWKKMLWYRRGIVYILLFLAMKLVIFCFTGTTTNESLEQNREAYDYYMEILEGKLTEEKRDYLEAESLRLAEIKLELGQIQQSYYSGKLKEEEYRQNAASMEEDLAREEGFQAIFNQYIYVRTDPENRYFVYSNGWDQILSNQSADYLGILLLLVLIVPVLCQEYSCGMDQLLITSGKGARSQIWSKVVVCLLTAGIIGIACIGMEYVTYCVRYGLPCGSYPLQSLESYQYVEKSMSLFEAFCMQAAMKLFGYIYTAIVILFISSCARKLSLSLTVSIAVMMLPFIMVDNYNQFTRIPGPWGPLVGTVFLSGTEYTWNTYWQVEELVSTELSWGEWGRTMAEALCILVGMVYLMKKSNGNRWVERAGKKNNRRMSGKNGGACALLLLLVCGTLTGCGQTESSKAEENGDTYIYNSSAYRSGETEKYVFYDSITDEMLVCEEKETGKRFEAVKDAMYIQTETGETLGGTIELGNSIFTTERYLYYIRWNNTYDRWNTAGDTDYFTIVELDTEDYSEKDFCKIDVNGGTDSLLGLRNMVSNPEFYARNFFVDGKTIYLVLDGEGVYRLKPWLAVKEKIITEEKAGNIGCDGYFIYYMNSAGELVQYDMNTGDTKTIEDVVAYDFFLWKDGVYYQNLRDNNRIYYWNFETGEITKIGDVPALWLVCDSEYIYYVDEENQWLYRMDKSGDNVELVTEEYPIMLYVFDKYDYLYMDAMSENGDKRVLRVDKHTLEITEVE